MLSGCGGVEELPFDVPRRCLYCDELEVGSIDSFIKASIEVPRPKVGAESNSGL